MIRAPLGAVALACSLAACRGADSTPNPSPGGGGCPGAPGCGCRNETGEVACELAGVNESPSTTKPGNTAVTAKYTSKARPGALGYLSIDVPASEVAAAHAYLDAHKTATCHFDFTSAPCAPSDTLAPLIPKYGEAAK